MNDVSGKLVPCTVGKEEAQWGNNQIPKRAPR